MDSSLLVFPTDLVDEGIEAVLTTAGSECGATGVVLAAAYHDARDIFPHNPSRLVYFHEPGAIFFEPDEALYRGLPFVPLRSRLFDGRDLVRELVASSRQREMEPAAWVVLLHTDRGRELEPFSPRNAFGDPYLTHLCPSNPHVRAYARALLTDVAATGVDKILLESFHFQPFPHGYHHERAFVAVDPTTSFLLSLCFCLSCTDRASAAGVGVDRLRGDVSRHIREGLATPSFAQLNNAEIRGIADGAMSGYLDSRMQTVTSLAAELVEAVDNTNADLSIVPIDPSGAIQGYAGGRPDGPPACAISWQLGVDVNELAAITGGLEAMSYATDPARIRFDLEAYLDAIPTDTRLGTIMRPMPPDCETADNLAEKVSIARQLGLRSVDFYHYGLASRESLARIKPALEEA